MRAISHAMVTVDEEYSHVSGLRFVPSADLVAFEDLGGVKIAEVLPRHCHGSTRAQRSTDGR